MFKALLIAALVAWSWMPTAASAKSMPTCKTPRDAADSVFSWQLGNQQSLRNASRCFERTGRSQQQLERVAARLKAVYDSQGAYVEMDTIPDSADYLDAQKNARVVPHAELPRVVIEKQGDKWLWTRTSLDRIDVLYADELGWLDRAIQWLPRGFQNELAGMAVWQYLALLILVSLGLVVRKLLRAVVASRLERLAAKHDQRWIVKIVDVVASPGATLATAVILRLGYPQLRLPIHVSVALAATVKVLITISVVWGVYRSVDLLSAKLAEHAEKTESKLDDQLVPLLRKSLKVVVFIIGALVVLQNLHFDVTTLLASVSIGTLAFGLAAKDTIANLFGSISIFVDNPFQIGDWINVAGVDGTVEEVGFRSTRIRTFYDSVVVMPNAKIADSKIDNYGQRTLRRCFMTVGLTYDTTPEQMQAFVEGCRAIIKSSPLARKDKYEVHMSGMGDSALEVMLYFFFECATWSEELRARHNVLLEIMRLAEAVGVSFAFPTQSLHIESAVTPSPRRAPSRFEPERLRALVEGFAPDGEVARPDGPQITASGLLPEVVITADQVEAADNAG